MARAVLIILDGVGIGGAPDAAAYGDAGSDTLGNLARAVGGLDLPVLASLGLGNCHPIAGVAPAAAPRASHGALREVSAGKDSTTGHWELMGVVTETPFPTYPHGFPPEVMTAFRELTGYDFLGNVVASGTEIIDRLGDEHVRTGKPIVYTSADSVFQIAAHEGVIPLAELYRICEVARGFLVPPHQVSRVIGAQRGRHVAARKIQRRIAHPLLTLAVDGLQFGVSDAIGNSAKRGTRLDRLELIGIARPGFINIGADSKRCGLEEPSAGEISIAQIKAGKVQSREITLH